MEANRFTSPDVSLSVNVHESAFGSMVAICRKSRRKETGGILVGRYSERGATAEILEALPPPSDSMGSSSTFHRGTSGLSKELATRWEKAGAYYIGEWHYHPVGNGQPSDQDINQMVDFARQEDMQSPVPILVIVIPSGHNQHEIRVFLFTQEGHTVVLNAVRETQKER